MTKYSWYIIDYIDENAYHYASAERISLFTNLLSLANKRTYNGDMEHAIPYAIFQCSSKKQALDIADAWNTIYKTEHRFFVDEKINAVEENKEV